MSRKIFITGSAGFIGFHLCKKLFERNEQIVGLDNMNTYYDVKLKESRLEELNLYSSSKDLEWEFIKGDLEDKDLLNYLFNKYKPDIVFNLAAQAGVRYSLQNPSAYINSNIVGFNNLLECCHRYQVENFIFASSSSVYGGNIKIPFSEKDPVDHPVSLYAATKKANELIAHTYSHLYNIPCTGLRFFTVYGPWGRPDMAPMMFTKSILENKPIDIYNQGHMSRDFTYIDDIIEVMIRLIDKPAKPDKTFIRDNPNPDTSWAPYKILNIGNSNSINLMDFITTLETELNKKAIKNFLPMQPGDVKITSANTNSIAEWIGFRPNTSLDKGIQEFVRWYKDYYLD